MRIVSTDITKFIYFVAVDATDFTSRETGLASFTVRSSLNGAASVLWTTPTVNETDITNMPGVYELLADEQTTLGSSDDVEELCIHITHAGMAPVTRTIEIVRAKITEGETLTVASGEGEANVVTMAANVVTAAAINADAITSSELATSAAEEIADTIWDEPRADHDIAGSFGQGVASVQGDVTGDLLGSVATVTTLTGHTPQTGDSFLRLGAPAGASVSADIAAIQTDVAGIGGAAMRGTDSAFLASVGGALADAASAGDPTAVDTLMQYVKQLINILVGTAGIPAFPLESAPANAVSLAEVIRAIHADVTGLNGDPMRGTDAASTLVAADINTEVSDVLKVDTITEPAQAAPPTTGVATMEDALRYMFFALTNRVDSDAVSNQLEFFNRAGAVVQWRKALTDAASIASEASGASGP